jgi:ATP-dependent helicase/nuclease subunit B
LFNLDSDVADCLARGGSLVVPTRQRAHAVRLAHAAAQLNRGTRVWASPDVLAAPGWMRRECERRAQGAPAEWPRVLSATEEWWLWREVTREAIGSAPFLSVEALAESLRGATARAAEWRIEPARGVPGSEAELLRLAQRLFAARCRELGAASVAALLPRLATIAPSAPPLLRGFEVPPRALAQLAAGVATTRAAASSAPARQARAVRTASAQAQLDAIAEWCRAQLSAAPGARLLVVLPGAAAARERLAALIQGALDPAAILTARDPGRGLVAIEGGEPLGALPLPAQALASLEILSGAATDVGTLALWLTSPHWAAPRAVTRAALALAVRECGVASLDLRGLLGTLQLVSRDLRPAARELEGLLRRAAGLLGEGSASPRRWSERFETALASLGWPGPLSSDGALQQTRLRWRELLEEFGALAACAHSLARDVALAELRVLAAHTAYRPADEDVPVTISPMLADPVVVYDGMWVASLSADVLPMPVAPDPFLPLAAQLAAGLPEASAAARRSQAHALLEAWRRSARELTLSVPVRDGDLELLPSPCLAGLTPIEERPRPVWLPMRLHREAWLEAREDASGAPFTAHGPLPAGTRALTLQNDCAFRAYAELRLGARAPETIEPGVPMDQRGLLLHAALQLLWERLHDSAALGALTVEALAALIGACVAGAARTLAVEVRGRRRRGRTVPDGQFDLFSVLSPALTRECRRAQALILKLCELERTRAPFTVAAIEQVSELSLGGARVRLRLDRVDSVAGGRVVLDYKSGKPGSPDWFGERPTHPQLLAYLAALGNDVVALATVNLTAREVRFTGVAAAANLLPRVRSLPPVTGAAALDWALQLKHWREVLERLIQAFLAGEAHVDPAPGACDYCHLTDLCRIGTHAGPELIGHAGEGDE